MNTVCRNIIVSLSLFTTMIVCTSFAGLRVRVVSFTGFFGNDSLQPGVNYYSEFLKDSVSVSTCRFYISDFRVYHGNNLIARHDYKLIDVFDTTENHFTSVFHTPGNITEIRFYLGVDSAANVSGANKGDLDPTKGMYWAWQSGYINLKLEGRSNLCSKSRGEFQYHLGGYAAPYNARREVVIALDKDAGNIPIRVDVQKFLEQVDMRSLSTVMSPSDKSVELSGKATSMFSVR